MEELSVGYCRICGSILYFGADICLQCGSSQTTKKKRPSTAGFVVLLVGGLVGIILLGALSAIAVPRYVSHGIANCDTVALKNVVAVKQAMELHHAANGAYPDSLEQIPFKPDEGVSVILLRADEKVCTLVVRHVHGSMEYVASPGSAPLFSRDRRFPDSKLVTVK